MIQVVEFLFFHFFFCEVLNLEPHCCLSLAIFKQIHELDKPNQNTLLVNDANREYVVVNIQRHVSLQENQVLSAEKSTVGVWRSVWWMETRTHVMLFLASKEDNCLNITEWKKKHKKTPPTQIKLNSIQIIKWADSVKIGSEFSKTKLDYTGCQLVDTFCNQLNWVAFLLACGLVFRSSFILHVNHQCGIFLYNLVYYSDWGRRSNNSSVK